MISCFIAIYLNSVLAKYLIYIYYFLIYCFIVFFVLIDFYGNLVVYLIKFLF